MECSDEDNLSECEMASESDNESDEFYFAEPEQTNPTLLKDIERLRNIFPDSNVSTKIVSGLNQMDLEMSLPTSHFNEIVMSAWGLKIGLPIKLHLTLHSNLYLSSSDDIRVDVFQDSSATCNRNGTLQQLKKIAQELILRLCRILTNETFALAVAICGANAGHESIEEQETRAPQPDYGYLAQIYFYMQERLVNLNKFCPICDEEHPRLSSNMLKPVVCNKPLCIFSFQTLGVTSYITSWIQMQPQVVQLLVLLTKAAAFSKRHAIILSPFPTIVHPEKQDRLILDPAKDHTLVRTLVKRIPKISDIQHLSEDALRKTLGSLHVLCYPLLRWIISSNRSHIEFIPFEKQLKFIGTRHQFVLFNRPPEEDGIFKERKKTLGSVFAFHGSPIDNWHSIVRNGLMIASGTDKQLNGARYGHAIYLSPILNKALGYLSTAVGQTIVARAKEPIDKVDDFICDSSYLYCLTLCEVINDCHLKKNTCQIWTCRKNKNVCTRFFFVYDKQCPVLPDIDANITTVPYCDQINAALTSLYS